MPTRKLEALLRRQAVVDEREITALRNEYLIHLAKLAAHGAGAPLITKAAELLKPRYWARSSWRERGKILDTVGWLLRAYETQHIHTRKEFV